MPKMYGFEQEHRKGIIPYAWFTDFDRLNGPTQFLPEKKFFPKKLQDSEFHKWHDSTMEQERALASEYTKAGREYFGSWNPRAELEAYLKEDVLILAEGLATESCFWTPLPLRRATGSILFVVE